MKLIVQEQFRAGHLKPSTSPWNTPIFVIKKRSGKWRLLHDLRAINATMVPRGSLQPGLPSPVAIPAGFFKIVIDLKDCFFSIPLHPADSERFAFSLPVTNCAGPYARYQWTVLPQGMANSPSLCQKFVSKFIDPFRSRFPQTYIIQYTDDILIGAATQAELFSVTELITATLRKAGFVIAPDKIQLTPPQLFLGFELFPHKIHTQKAVIRTQHLSTLHDFQRLLGDINWLRPYLCLSTGQLKPLFDILKGPSDPNSPRNLTPEAQQALRLVEQAIAQQSISYFTPDKPLFFLVFSSSFSPTGLLWQENPLFWVHLPAAPTKVLSPYPSLVVSLLQAGCQHSLRLFGRFPDTAVTPYTPAQLQWLAETRDEWAVFLCGFTGRMDNHFPSNKLVQFFTLTPMVFPTITKSAPIAGAALVFTDGSSTGRAAYSVNGQITSFLTPYSSAQLVELAALVQVFSMVSEPFNLYTDSFYIAASVPLLETVPFIKPTTNASPLFLQLQQLILSRSAPFFIAHIRAHSTLPGPLTEGNSFVDSATQIFSISVQSDPVALATKEHSLHHLNAQTLRLRFKITREQARQIVKQCKTCLTFLPEPHLGVNPRGLTPGELWQMDITHLSSFASLKYIHVTVDTCSGFICASLQTGESAAHIISHVLYCLSVLPRPSAIKTDNGSGFTSSKFRSFCAAMHIKQIFGIPHNPTGQAIVERANQTLKNMIAKLSSNQISFYSRKSNGPRPLLSHALFVLNFLSFDQEGRSAADRLWHPTTKNDFKQVLWKDVHTGTWQGPHPVLIWGKGHACIHNPATNETRWLPERLIKLYNAPRVDPPEDSSPSFADADNAENSETEV